MGRRTGTETIAHLVVAFLQQATWRQKELEGICGVGARPIRRALLDLAAAGVPLEREEDSPHVFWSVPAGWPGQGARAGGLDGLDVSAVARLVARLPRSQARERALAKLVAPAFGLAAVPNVQEDRVRDQILHVLEDGVRQRVPVLMGYYSASRDADSVRTASVQRIVYGDHPRFIAHCHTSSRLKWFRADRVKSARLEAAGAFQAVEDAEVMAFVRESMDGFRSDTAAMTCELVIRPREARWALPHMPYDPQSALVTSTPEGAHVVLRTAALEVLARYLVGLGNAVRVIAPERLRELVVGLARGALTAQGADGMPGARLNTGPARSIQSPGTDRIGPARGADSVAMKPRAR